MKIDPQNGTVTLPNGCSIGADCTQDAFRTSAAGADADRRGSGTLPWIHYRFSGGGTFLRIRYGNRMADATEADQARNPERHDQRVRWHR